jgi:CheY-like chemotaxis protein
LALSNTKTVILVVEDEPLLRLAAIDMVEDAGFEAVEASNATDAVRILESRLDIQIVFTDVDMPGGIDGMRLAALIRDRWPPITIIVTSGQLHADQVKLPSGSMFFPKPYRESEVVAAFRNSSQ